MLQEDDLSNSAHLLQKCLLERSELVCVLPYEENCRSFLEYYTETLNSPVSMTCIIGLVNQRRSQDFVSGGPRFGIEDILKLFFYNYGQKGISIVVEIQIEVLAWFCRTAAASISKRYLLVHS